MNRPSDPKTFTTVGLWSATLLGAPLSASQFYGEPILLALGQTPEAAALASSYLMGLAWCLMPAWWFIALRGFMQSVNWPEPGLWITLAAIPINALLAFALIYGEFGIRHEDCLHITDAGPKFFNAQAKSIEHPV